MTVTTSEQSAAIAPELLSSTCTNADLASEFASPAAAASVESRPLSEVVLELREAEGDR